MLLTGEVNRHNCRNWSDVNFYLAMETHSQMSQTLNVWAGILGNNIVGLFFIEGNVNGVTYLHLPTTKMSRTMNTQILENDNFLVNEILF